MGKFNLSNSLTFLTVSSPVKLKNRTDLIWYSGMVLGRIKQMMNVKGFTEDLVLTQ